MKDYQVEEWKRIVAQARKSLDSACPLIEDEVLVAVGDELKQLRADNKALRDYIASLMSTLPKLKADAIRDAMKDCEYRVTGVGHVISHVELSKHADKIEQGEK